MEIEIDSAAKLKELLKTDLYVVKATPPPKYMSCFAINDKSIVLIHKWEKTQETFYRSEKFSSAVSPTDFDITGQPLECPFTEGLTLDDSVFAKEIVKTEEDFHAPLTKAEARLCLSMANLYLKSPVPIWVLTDAEGKDSVVLLGAKTFNGWGFRSWVSIQGKQTIIDNNIKSMINDHQKLAVLPNAQVQSKVTALFNTDDAYDSDTEEQSITLEVTWRKPSFEVPLSEADTSVIVKTMVGSKESIASHLWQQVLLLSMYLDTITKWKTAVSQEVPYQRESVQIPSRRDIFPNSEKATLSPRDTIFNLLKDSDHLSLGQDISRAKAQDFKKTRVMVEEVISGQHASQDFTDKLWNVLIDVNTYHELKTFMQLVLQEVKRQPIKPYIMRKNQTRLAQALENGETKLLFEPLELLLEVGVEKLKNDYRYIFYLSQLANKQLFVVPDLPGFSEIISSSDWEVTVRSWLTWFACVHTVLDIVCLTEEKLNSALTSVSEVALKTYLGDNSPVSSIEDILKHPLHEIKAAVKTPDVSFHIGRGCMFNQWLLNLTSSSASREVSSTYLVTLNLPFPEKLMKKVIEKDSYERTVIADDTVAGYDIDASYYTAKLVTVGDKFF